MHGAGSAGMCMFMCVLCLARVCACVYKRADEYSALPFLPWLLSASLSPWLSRLCSISRAGSWDHWVNLLCF